MIIPPEYKKTSIRYGIGCLYVPRPYKLPRRRSPPPGMAKARIKDSPPQISLRQSDKSYFACPVQPSLQKRPPSAPAPFTGPPCRAKFPGTLCEAHPLSQCMLHILFYFSFSVNSLYSILLYKNLAYSASFSSSPYQTVRFFLGLIC